MKEFLKRGLSLVLAISVLSSLSVPVHAENETEGEDETVAVEDPVDNSEEPSEISDDSDEPEGTPSDNPEDAPAEIPNSDEEPDETEQDDETEVAEEETSEIRTITAFDDFSITGNYLYYSAKSKPSLNSVLADMPETISVYLDNEDEPTDISVTWTCIEQDYTTSESYYFQFSPEWDEESYVLSDSIDLWSDGPYVGVFLTETGGEVTTASGSVTGKAAETTAFEYLTGTLGLNTATACGILANLACESGFITNNLENYFEYEFGLSDEEYTEMVDNGTYLFTTYNDDGTVNISYDNTRDSFSHDWHTRNDYCKSKHSSKSWSKTVGAGYGICQWTYYSRKQGLYDMAKKMGGSISDILVQMNYFASEYEFTSVRKNYLNGLTNDEQGAYDSGYYFCKYYERPANTENSSITRGNLAKNTYWPVYKNGVGEATYKLSISFNIDGETISVNPCGTVDVYINGSRVANDVSTFSEDGLSVGDTYEIQDIKMVTGAMYDGVYSGKLSGTISGNTSVTLKYSSCQDLGDDFYAYIAYDAKGVYLTADRSDGNVQLGTIDSTDKYPTSYDTSEIWHFVRISTGDYAGSYQISNEYAGGYLTADGAGTDDGTNIMTSASNNSASQRWFIYKHFDGKNYTVAPAYNSGNVRLVMDVENGENAASGSNIRLYTNSETTGQAFNIVNLSSLDDSALKNYKEPSVPVKHLPGFVTDNGATYTISWDSSALQSKAFDSRTYTLEIRSGIGTEGKLVKKVTDLTKMSYTLKLDDGIYTARVTAVNTCYADKSTRYNSLYFTTSLGGTDVTDLESVTGGLQITWSGNSSADGYYIYRKEASGSYKNICNLAGSESVTYKDTGAVSGTTYTYQIVSYLSADDGTPMKGSAGKTMTEKYLGIPVISSVSNNTGSIAVKWDNLGGADSYEIYRSKNSESFTLVASVDAGKDTSVTYEDSSGIVNGAKYRYYIVADFGTSKSAASNRRTIYRLERPAKYRINCLSSGIKLEWYKNGGATGVRIYRSDDGGAFNLVQTITGFDTLSWTDTEASVNGTKYQYKLVYYKTASGTTCSSAGTTASKYYLTAPSVTTIEKADGGVHLVWKSSTKADGYKIYRSTDGGKTFTLVKTRTGAATTGWTDTDVRRGVTYYYKLVAYKSGNGINYNGVFSGTKSIKY